MAISDLFNSFRSAAPTPAPTPTPAPNQQTPAQPGNIPENAPTNNPGNQNTAPNGVVPNQQIPAPSNEQKSPLDEFSTLWQNDPNAAPNKNDTGFNVDPKKLMDVAKKVNFKSVITPQQLDAISKGGPEAQAAFADALNAVAQQSYAQSSFAATKIAEAAAKKMQESLEAKLPQFVRTQQVNDQLRENPVFSHPAAQPILSAIQAQMSQKYPNATAAELATMSQDYLSAFSNALNPPKIQAEKIKPSEDWSSFL